MNVAPHVAERPAVDKTAFREAMARIPAAVHIVTTDGPGGRAGATVSAMCSLTDEPPSVIICLNRSLRTTAAVLANGHLALNTLASDSAELSSVFAGQAGLEMEERFRTGAAWGEFASGLPYLATALCNLDLRVEKTVESGTHFALFCRVEDLRLNRSDAGLVYHNRRYILPAQA